MATYDFKLHVKLKYHREPYKPGEIVIGVPEEDKSEFEIFGEIVNEYPDETNQPEIANKEEVEAAVSKYKTEAETESALTILIDWLFYNFDEVKKYVKEIGYLESGIVYSGAPPVGMDINSLENSFIFMEDAKGIIQATESVIMALSSEEYDVFIDKYYRNFSCKAIADFEEMEFDAVVETIRKIRESEQEKLIEKEIDFEDFLGLRRKLYNVIKNKAS